MNDQAFDDVTGDVLYPTEVMKERLKELDYIENKKVWRKISRREALARGITIIKSRWIDINNEDAAIISI